MAEVSAALTTPFRADLSIDVDRLAGHLRGVLDSGCDSATLFGTTGEGASVDVGARLSALRELVSGGVSTDRLRLCLHGAASASIIEQIRAAEDIGVTRFLLPPPSYDRSVTMEGLFAWFDRCLSAARRSQFLLYHIPQVTGIGLSSSLFERLARAHGDSLAGVKDSSGDQRSTTSFLSIPGLRVFVGDERQLAKAASCGGAGAISGLANVAGQRLRAVLHSRRDDPGVNDLVDRISEYPVVPAVKCLVAAMTGDPEWRRTVPPLRPLTNSQADGVGRLYESFCASH